MKHFSAAGMACVYSTFEISIKSREHEYIFYSAAQQHHLRWQEVCPFFWDMS
jgi:hypothetical protein